MSIERQSRSTGERVELTLVHIVKAVAVAIAIVFIAALGMTFNFQLATDILSGSLLLGGIVGLPVLYALDQAGKANLLASLVLGGVLGAIPMMLAAWAPGLGFVPFSAYQLYGINVIAAILSWLNWPLIGMFGAALAWEQIHKQRQKIEDAMPAADGGARVGD